MSSEFPINAITALGFSKQLIEKLPFGIAVLDNDLTFVFANDHWPISADVDSSDVVGKSLQAVHPTLPDQWKALIQRGLGGETINNDEESSLNVNGEMQYLDWSLFPYVDDSQAIAGIVITLRDNTQWIAEQVKRETLLSRTAENRRQNLEFIAQINEQLAKATTEQQILQAVAQFTQRFGVMLSALNYAHLDEQGQPYGYSVEALQTGDGTVLPVDSLPQTFFPDDVYPLNKLVYQAPYQPYIINNGTDESVSEPTRYALTATGLQALIMVPLRIGTRWEGMMHFGWATPQDFPTDLIEILRSIMPTVASAVSNRRLYLEALNTADRLLELDRMKNEFISTMSHELRTPLNAIIGLSDVILSGLSGEINDRVREDTQTIFDSGQQLLNIVNDVLDIAKIESGRLQLKTRTLAIEPMLTQALNTFGSEVKDTNLQLTSSIADDLPTVTVDPARIQQVLNNLIANAIKFSDEKGAVEVSAVVEAGFIKVSVRDEGIGIAPEHHEFIFEQFRQVEGSITRKKGGIGLGLPLSKRLVEMHGGEMGVESALGEGATFYFTLPVA